MKNIKDIILNCLFIFIIMTTSHALGVQKGVRITTMVFFPNWKNIDKLNNLASDYMILGVMHAFRIMFLAVCVVCGCIAIFSLFYFLQKIWKRFKTNKHS